MFSLVWGRGKKVTAILRRSSSRGLGTPEVKIASVPVPAFTGNKMASSNLYRYERKNSRPIGQNPLKDQGASNLKKVPLRDRINQFPGQHLSVKGNAIFCTACKEVVSSKKSIFSWHCGIPLCLRTYYSSVERSAVVSCVLSEQVCNITQDKEDVMLY